MAIKSGKDGYLLDHLGNHEGTLLIKDFRQNFQTRQNLVDLPVWGNEERCTVSLSQSQIHYTCFSLNLKENR